MERSAPRLQSSSGPGTGRRSSDWLQSSSGPVDTPLRLQSSSGPEAKGGKGLPNSPKEPYDKKMAIRSSPGAVQINSAERERSARWNLENHFSAVNEAHRALGERRGPIMVIDGERWRLYSLRTSEVGSRFDEAKIRESEREIKSREDFQLDQKERLAKAMKDGQDNLNASCATMKRNNEMIAQLKESNAKMSESILALRRTMARRKGSSLLGRRNQRSRTAKGSRGNQPGCVSNQLGRSVR